jgi:hypothetical protein
MATERLNIPIVPEFGGLAVGELGAGLMRSLCGTRPEALEFGSTAQRQGEPHAELGHCLSYRCSDRWVARLRNHRWDRIRRREGHIRDCPACIPRFRGCRSQSARGPLSLVPRRQKNST